MPEEVKNSELENYLKTLLGKQYAAFLSAQPEPTAIRTNTLKASPEQICELLTNYQYEYDKIPFSPDGFILQSDRLPLSHSLAFFEGFFQYQGISSQLPPLVLDVKPGDRVLDMTAAPGSKSTQLAAMLGNKGELVLNDSSYHRLPALQANMQRSGAINHYVLKHRGENLSRLYPEYFDKILLDAPCTALGTYFSMSEKYSWWSGKKLEKLSKLQYQLLVSAIKCLRIGGEMVYSTCSVSPEENELIIEKFMNKYPVSVEKISPIFKSKFDSGLTSYNNSPISNELEKSLRIWPHVHSFEGFFVIKLKKTARVVLEKESIPADTIMTNSADYPEINKVLKNLSDSWGINPEIWNNFRYILTKTRLWMLSPNIKGVPSENFVSGGLLLGEKRLHGWKLVNGSAQYLSKNITNRRITLSDQELNTLFRESKIKYKNLAEDYYVLDYKERVIGSLYHEKGTLRIRLPHLFTRITV
ncbi:MAG: RsmB/NOP family class I SAM-dependent RNA methyltransferase [Calditrichia bacterium]|nr:RsmB/NOP family class I SAM-dependent RNA methyltransferase [Calditrichia bacterium]